MYELQQVDLAIAGATARKASLSDGAAEREEVDRATAHLSDVRGRLASVRSKLRILELEVQSLQQKRAKVHADLYGGRIRNPKELEAMQEEVEALDRSRGRLEDEMLALLDQVERLEPEERSAVAAVEAAQAALERQTAWFQQTAREVERELVDLAARRAALVTDLDESLVRRYDRLRERKGGIAVVAVHNGICDGCHVVIPDRLLRRLEEDPETQAACDGCGRLLYVPRG